MTLLILLFAACTTSAPVSPAAAPPLELGPAAPPPSAPAPPEPDCGWTPEVERGLSRAFYSYNLGCGLAPSSPEAWKTVTEVNEVSIELLPDKTVVRAVFVDAQLRRVVPSGRELRYDMQFKKRHKGTLSIDEAGHRDGVFTFELPANEMAAPCETHLFFYYSNGAEELKMWIDDWNYGC